jgi:hypothetical protein
MLPLIQWLPNHGPSGATGPGVSQLLVTEGAPDPRLLRGEVDRVLPQMFHHVAAQCSGGPWQGHMEGTFGLEGRVAEALELVTRAHALGPQLGGARSQDPNPGLVHAEESRPRIVRASSPLSTSSDGRVEARPISRSAPDSPEGVPLVRCRGQSEGASKWSCEWLWTEVRTGQSTPPNSSRCGASHLFCGQPNPEEALTVEPLQPTIEPSARGRSSLSVVADSRLVRHRLDDLLEGAGLTRTARRLLALARHLSADLL